MVDLACSRSPQDPAPELGAARRAWPSRTRPLAAHWRALRSVTEADPTPSPAPSPLAETTTDATATTGGTSAR